MEISISKMEIEKLNEKNFQCWKFRVKNLLVIYDLEDVVFACEANFSPNLRYDEHFLKIWKKRDSMAKHILSINITDEILKNYTSCETAADLWNKLENSMDEMNEAIACGTELINARTIKRKLKPIAEHELNSRLVETHLVSRTGSNSKPISEASPSFHAIVSVI